MNQKFYKTNLYSFYSYYYNKNKISKKKSLLCPVSTIGNLTNCLANQFSYFSFLFKKKKIYQYSLCVYHNIYFPSIVDLQIPLYLTNSCDTNKFPLNNNKLQQKCDIPDITV